MNADGIRPSIGEEFDTEWIITNNIRPLQEDDVILIFCINEFCFCCLPAVEREHHQMHAGIIYRPF